MKKLTLSMLVTLDGFIEGQNGDLSWFLPPEEFFDLYSRRFMERFDTILLGGKSFKLFSGHWPTATEPIADLMNGYRKVGVGKSVEETGWNNATVARGDLGEIVEELKREKGRDIVSFGGARLGASLIRHNLVDELMITVCPTLIGKGTPLFSENVDPKKMKLLSSKTFPSGGVVLTYQPL